jgi:hypothetical protein
MRRREPIRRSNPADLPPFCVDQDGFERADVCACPAQAYVAVVGPMRRRSECAGCRCFCQHLDSDEASLYRPLSVTLPDRRGRSIATHSLTAEENQELLKKQRKLRPSSPHFTICPLNSCSAVFH